MDRTTSISSSRNHDETGMEKVQYDLEAVTRLYGLLHKGPVDEILDVTSRALLMRMLEDATKQALQMRMTDEMRMEQAQSDLETLNRLYGLLHKGPTDENLDKTSKALLMRMLDDATKRALLWQTKMISGSPVSPGLERNLSIRSDRRTLATGPRQSLNPLASPSLSLHQASERSHRLNLQDSASSSRDGRHVHGHRHAADEPVLSRLTSNRSRSAMAPQHHQSLDRQRSGLSLYRLPIASTSKHGTVTGRSRRADLPDVTRPSYGGGDRSSLQRSTSRRGAVAERRRRDDLGDGTRPNYGRGDHSSLERSSMRLSVSRELSRRRDGHATPRRVGAEGSSSTRHLGRLGSGVSLGVTSRRGSERAGRGVATPRYSSSASSNNEVATIRSRIVPYRELTERSLRRHAEEEGSTRRRRWEDGAAGWASSRARRTLNRIDSVSTYSISSAGAASYTSLSVSSASASSYSPPVSRRGRGAQPAYAFQALADTLRNRRRRRREILEKRVGRLRKLKEKFAMLFHHRHDHHHHHHHHHGHGQEGPSRRDVVAHNRKSPWKYPGEMLHRKKGQNKKKTVSQRGVSVPAKRRGGGHMRSLFDAMRQLRSKRKPPASVKMMNVGTQTKLKRMHWWQQLRRRRGRGMAAGSKPRRRLGFGKGLKFF